MRVMWITNTILPVVADYISEETSPFGGWLDVTSRELLKKGVTLYSLFTYKKKLKGQEGKLIFLSFQHNRNITRYNKTQEDIFINAIQLYKPDIIHCFGTEFSHSLACMKAAKKENLLATCIISIQGLVSKYSHYYYAGLKPKQVFSFTLRDFLRLDNIYFQKRKFIQRGKLEIEAIKLTENIIGRTEWDHACTYFINNQATYHFCNENLRETFYNSNKWCIENCRKYSLFMSQGNYPIKGLHNVLKILKKVLVKYPETTLYITGNSPINAIKKRNFTYYNKIIKNLIISNKLEKNVCFLGLLNEAEMTSQYLKSNIFISASSIENSPNSVGEAMILGVPIIASDVGGIKNLLTHNIEGLIYPESSLDILAFYIIKLFEDLKLQKQLSKNAILKAEETHNRGINTSTLYCIYEDILKGG